MARILVVDDADFMRATLSNLLQQLGHDIAGEAKNGEQAVRLYQTLNPDLVTMDITMPVMSGIEAIKAIKAYDKQAIIVVCSAMGQQKMIIESIEFGATDFIVKPFDTIRLTETIDRALMKKS